MIRILLVEDDESIMEMLANSLSAMGDYRIFQAPNGKSALNFREEFDLILLDVMLPDVNGIELCSLLRKKHSCPIIFISCLDDRSTITEALFQGGDDYVVKPIDSQILHARILANLRRVRMDRGPEREQAVLSCRAFSLDTESGIVRMEGREIPLLPIECQLLSFLMNNAGSYYKSKELYREIWGQDSAGDARTVLVHMHNLRKRLEGDSRNPRFILHVRGKGYTFNARGTTIDEN